MGTTKPKPLKNGITVQRRNANCSAAGEEWLEAKAAAAHSAMKEGTDSAMVPVFGTTVNYDHRPVQ